MRKKTWWWLSGSWPVILGLILMGCASGGVLGPTDAQQTKTTEQLLSAAGFKQIFPTTPHLKTRLQAMPQKQIFMVNRGTKVFYVYADATGCGCLYAGNQQQYQAFQNLVAQYKMASMQMAAAEMNEAASWDWGEWGEAGPWY